VSPSDKDQDKPQNELQKELIRLWNFQNETSKTYDRTLTTLSAGALVLSVTFLQNMKTAAVSGSMCWITTSWVCFSVALIAILAALLCSQYGTKYVMEESIDLSDGGAIKWEININKKDSWFGKTTNKRPTSSRWHVLVHIFNWSSIVAFCLGVFCFVLFGILNPPIKERQAGTPFVNAIINQAGTTAQMDSANTYGSDE
jgi:hypothetical protein